MVARANLIFGLHVHIGVEDRETAIQIMNGRTLFSGTDGNREPATVQHLRRLLGQLLVRAAQEDINVGFEIQLAAGLPQNQVFPAIAIHVHAVQLWRTCGVFFHVGDDLTDDFVLRLLVPRRLRVGAKRLFDVQAVRGIWSQRPKIAPQVTVEVPGRLFHVEDQWRSGAPFISAVPMVQHGLSRENHRN